MRKQSIFILTLVLLTSLYSCTITKRHYTSGYSIQWNNHVKPALLKLSEGNNKETLAAEESSPNSDAQLATELLDVDLASQQDSALHSIPPSKRIQPILHTDSVKPSLEAQEMQTKADQLISATKVHIVLTPVLTITLMVLLGYISVIFILGFFLISSIILTSLVRRFKSKYRQYRNYESYKKLVRFNVFNQIMLVLSIVGAAIILGIVFIILIYTM